MTADLSTNGTRPSDAVAERLDDPATAAALVTLLDHAELLSTLVVGLSGFVERGEVIMDSLADGVREYKSSRPAGPGAPSLAELGEVARELADAGPALRQVLSSPMVRPETIQLLGAFSAAATEGAATARADGTRIGALGALRSLRDPEVQRGLGVLTEIARALGRHLGELPTSTTTTTAGG